MNIPNLSAKHRKLTTTYHANKVMRKFKSIYFKANMLANRILGLPAQTKKEIKIFKKILDSFINKKIIIFEWGSGYSTIYYAQYLRKKGAEFEWHSIDNNQAWYEKIKLNVMKKNLRAYVQIYLKKFPSFWEKPMWGPIPPACGAFSPKSENEKTYVEFPKLLNNKFDILIVDARFRRHCIQTAKEVLQPEGIVILHDAQKMHYHIGLGGFQYGKFLHSGSWYPFQKIQNKIWIGSIENSKIFEALKQF